jgi:hypothetical protein
LVPSGTATAGPAFYVFTTATKFNANKSYDKFGVYAVLNFGDEESPFKAASAALREQNYGGEALGGGDTGPITEREVEIAARKILIQRAGKRRADEEEAGGGRVPGESPLAEG